MSPSSAKVSPRSDVAAAVNACRPGIVCFYLHEKLLLPSKVRSPLTPDSLRHYLAMMRLFVTPLMPLAGRTIPLKFPSSEDQRRRVSRLNSTGLLHELQGSARWHCAPILVTGESAHIWVHVSTGKIYLHQSQARVLALGCCVRIIWFYGTNTSKNWIQASMLWFSDETNAFRLSRRRERMSFLPSSCTTLTICLLKE